MPTWFVAANVIVALLLAFSVFAGDRRERRLEEDRWRPLPEWLSRALVNRTTEIAAGAIGVFLLGVVIWSGLWGTDQGGWNFSVTFVFVTFWIGLAIVSAFLGDVFRALNPWRALARAGGWALRRLTGRSLADPVPYPERVGRWPAVAAILAFGFIDQAFSGRGLPDVGTELPSILPATLALAVVLYSLYTFVMMAVFGVDEWLRRGEGFSVFFGMLATIAPLDVRDGRLGRRPWLAATGPWSAGVPGSPLLPLIAIALTLFDDMRWEVVASSLWATIQNELTIAGLSASTAGRVTAELYLLAILAATAALYALAVAATRPPRGRSRRELWLELGGCLVPIALAYTVMHYTGHLIQHGQAQFTYLLSDPLGRGWDLLGGAGHVIIDQGIGGDATWAIQALALALGHAGALLVVHDRSVAIYPDRTRALRAAWPALALIATSALLGSLLLI